MHVWSMGLVCLKMTSSRDSILGRRLPVLVLDIISLDMHASRFMVARTTSDILARTIRAKQRHTVSDELLI